MADQPLTGKALQEFLDGAADMDSRRVHGYALYERYYDGDFDTMLSDRARRYLELSGLRFGENFCEPVVDALAERLTVTGFTSSMADEASGEDPVCAQLDDWWQQGRLDALQGIVHTNTLVNGDAFLLVDWDEERERPRFVFNRPDGLKPCYLAERPDELDYVAKTWTTEQRGPLNPQGMAVRRLNLYYPGRVEKWFRLSRDDGGVWQRWTDQGDPGWPLWWTSDGQQDGEPLGVAPIHFRNKPLGKTYGRSRLKGVLPIQDELNKLVIDLNGILDNHAFPQDYVTGVSADNVQFKRVIGDIWQAADEKVKFGRLEATGAEGALAAIEACLSRMARRSRVPLHLLTGGDMPSGESLKAAEAGLVAVARDAMVFLGNSWEDVMMLALRLAAAHGELDFELPDDLTISAQWADPESRNGKDDWETQTLKMELGVSKHTLLAEKGYDPEVEAERRQAEGDQAQASLGKFLDGGAGFGVAPPGAAAGMVVN